MKKSITIDDLAIMVAKGFEETAKQSDMDKKFEEVDKRFNEMDKRFDRIENILIKQHSDKIENLERRVAQLETAFD